MRLALGFAPMKLAAAAFLLLFFQGLACAQDFNATAAHNAALPALLLPSQHNYAQAYESIPSFSDPFIFAYVAALLAQPSVDFRISSSKNTSLVWSWGEAHAAFLEEELPSGSLCPKGKKTMRASGIALANFSATFALSNSPLAPKTIPISPYSYFQIPFSQQELDTANISNGASGSLQNASLATLFVSINGTIALPYELQEDSFAYECVASCSNPNCATKCSCNKKTSFSKILRTRSVQGEKYFSLENREPLFFVLSPILLEQLATGGMFQIAAFSNRNFSAALLRINGREHEKSVHGYEIIQDEKFGFQRIISTQAQGASTLSFKCAATAINTFQLSGENSTYLHSCSANVSNVPSALGEQDASLLLSDDFGDKYQYDFMPLYRNYTLLAQNGTSPAFFAGNSTHRPAMELALLASHQNADFASFFQGSVFALLLSLFLVSLSRLLRS